MPLPLRRLHHVAIIATDYRRSLHFYTHILGLTLRAERQSYKADLTLGDTYLIELFSFPSPPPRPSYPEAAGLRHLAFEVDDIEASSRYLDRRGISHEPIRTDPYTGLRFLFFTDPDGLPIELYEKESPQ